MWRQLLHALLLRQPCTEAYIVYLFLMLRGFNGGCKDQNARCTLRTRVFLRKDSAHGGAADL